MAERPIFVPVPATQGLVRRLDLTISWNAGFAASQKKKNIAALHAAAAMAGYQPVLEASTKSDETLGRHLSAFHLKVTSGAGEIPLESAFQGSKVFEQGGPYTDLYAADPWTAKRDSRIRNSGKVIAFVFDGICFPIEPKTAFYDWLYIRSLFPHRAWLSRLSRYAGYSDIEFNPGKSINCQARSCALFVALQSESLLGSTMPSPEAFVQLLRQSETHAPEATQAPNQQHTLPDKISASI